MVQLHNASWYSVGKELPPIYDGRRDIFIRHHVVDIKLVDQRIGFVTSRNERYVFDRFDTKVGFPIRKDPNLGVIRQNWLLDVTPPTLGDIAAGDIIPPAKPTPWLDPREEDGFDIKDDFWRNELREYANEHLSAGFFRQVIGIFPSRYESYVWLYVHDAELGRPTKHLVLRDPHGPLQYVNTDAVKRDIERQEVRFRVYRNKVSDVVTKIAIHPYGVGRWPAHVADYNPFGIAEGLMRPPSKKVFRGSMHEREWARWQWIPQDDRDHPHPNDTRSHGEASDPGPVDS